LIVADDALIVYVAERVSLEEKKYMVAFLHLIEISSWQNDSYDWMVKLLRLTIAYELNEGSISSRRGVWIMVSYLTQAVRQIISNFAFN
jgi:hypothetical protein